VKGEYEDIRIRSEMMMGITVFADYGSKQTVRDITFDRFEKTGLISSIESLENRSFEIAFHDRSKSGRRNEASRRQ
jgi:hypothetical protein